MWCAYLYRCIHIYIYRATYIYNYIHAQTCIYIHTYPIGSLWRTPKNIIPNCSSYSLASCQCLPNASQLGEKEPPDAVCRGQPPGAQRKKEKMDLDLGKSRLHTGAGYFPTERHFTVQTRPGRAANGPRTLTGSPHGWLRSRWPQPSLFHHPCLLPLPTVHFTFPW